MITIEREKLEQVLGALEATIDVPCYGGHPKQEAAAAAIKESLAQPAQEPVAIPDCGEAGHDDGCCGNAQCLPSFRAVKTYHEGKPVYVSQTAPPPPECKTVAEQTAYAFGWWKALESVRTEQPTQEPVAQWQKRHHLWTEGAWENSEEHDAKQWRDKAKGWEIRALYTTPQPTEPRNFCPRCGKRTADLTVIHTCTPPEGGHQ